MVLLNLLACISVLVGSTAQYAAQNEFSNLTIVFTNDTVLGVDDDYSSHPAKPVPHPLPLPPKPTPLPPPPADIHVFEDQLFAESGSPYQKFGQALAASGHTVAVSTSPTSANARVYLYCEHWVNGSQRGFRLDGELASPSPKLDGFGTSIAMQDRLLAVGSPKDNAQGFSSGKAYVFSLPTPLPDVVPVSQSLSPAEPQKGSRFGQSVSMAGTTLAVGAPGYSVDTIKSCGAVYLFEQLEGQSQFGELQLLVGHDVSSTSFGQFGGVVSLRENLLAVSAASSSNGVLNGGAVHLYEPVSLNGSSASWGLTQTLQPASLASFAFFGHNVALSSRMALISAFNDEGSGVVYAFTRADASSLWQLESLLLPTDPSDPFNAFGSSLLLYERPASLSMVAVVGSSGDSTQSEMAGAIYVYGVKDSSVSMALTPLEKLTSNDSTSFTAYGHALAGVNGHLLVSAPLADSPVTATSGVVYVERNLLPYYLEVVDQVEEPPSSVEEPTGATMAALIRDALLSTTGIVLMALLPAAAVAGVTFLLVMRGSKTHKYENAPLNVDSHGNATEGSGGTKQSRHRKAPYSYFVNPLKRKNSIDLQQAEDVELPGLVQTRFSTLDTLYAPVNMHQIIRSPVAAEHTIYPSPTAMTQRVREALDKEEANC